jgi:hypothetical protein
MLQAGAILLQGWRKGDIKEENVRWIFGPLGRYFHSVLGSRANDSLWVLPLFYMLWSYICHSRGDWPFPLIASAEGKKFRYTPRSDFHVSVDQLVYLLVEVHTDKEQSDRYRMLLKGACVARLGRQFYVKPHIVVALYIENHAGHAVKDPRESVKNLDCRVEEVCQSPVALAIFVFCRSSSS